MMISIHDNDLSDALLLFDAWQRRMNHAPSLMMMLIDDLGRGYHNLTGATGAIIGCMVRLCITCQARYIRRMHYIPR